MTEPATIVLVVDDSPGTLGMLSAALEAEGYTVLVAQSGTAALALTERVTPAIVLMDAVMPGLDGFETCARFKRSGAHAAIPVIFMTGLTETEHVVRALDAGGVDYLTKPVAPAELVARVRVHLANARLTQSAQQALDTTGRYLLAIDRQGRVLWSTPQARAWLSGDGPAAETLPRDAVDWALACADAPGARRIHALDATPGRALDAHFVGQVSADEFLLRLAMTDPAHDAAILREKLNLTSREAEVLLWVGRAKTNRDIGEILDLSPRTVNKHLEQIFAKIGVENRAAAAIQVTRLLAGG